MKILIVQGTLRRGRQSIKVAEYVRERASLRDGIEVEMIDVERLDLPLLWERNHRMEADEIPAGLHRWHLEVTAADAIILVIPEYNGGYPAAFKNIFDALYPEYRRKPFAIVSVSAGFGGYTVVSQLRELINRVKGFVIPEFWMARNVGKSFDADGNLTSEFYEKDVERLLDETVWYTEAVMARALLDG